MGYFLTVVKDWSQQGRRRSVRALHQSLGPAKGRSEPDVSPPKEADHLLAGKDHSVRLSQADSRRHLTSGTRPSKRRAFANAIEVRQQEDKDDWDPEDIRYNIFRWITSSAGFAMGPCRVNPYTGQILDADVIFDADLLSSFKRQI